MQPPYKLSITHNNNGVKEVLKIAIGKKIKAERLKKNISRAELSRLTGIPLRTLEDWEAGKYEPTNFLGIVKLIEILNIKSNNI